MKRINNKNIKVGYFYVEKETQHECKVFNHLESSKRLALIKKQIKSNKKLNCVLFIPQLETIEGCLELVHNTRYINKIKTVSQKISDKNWFLDSKDTYVDKGTYEAAYMAASTVCTAIKYVTENKLKHVFCAVRPPGHHATSDKSGGFCIFNNIAIASKFFLNLYPNKKILIIDWDTHFGNGTFSLVKKLNSVYFFDISTIDLQNTQKKIKLENKHRQTLVRVPKLSNKLEYLKIFDSKLNEISETFTPDVVLLSAGFDTHKDDPMRGFSLDEKSYFQMTKSVLGSFTNVPIVSVLEGGYSPRALALSIEQHMLALTSNE